MNKKDAEIRIKNLRKEIEKHARDYYENDSPTISDEIYDSLVREIKSLEKDYPEYFDPNFIIYRVGGKPLHISKEKPFHQDALTKRLFFFFRALGLAKKNTKTSSQRKF